MFTLYDLSEYRQVVIQCHDNPDADAIGSGFALFRYFTAQKVPVWLVYGGRSVTKSNLTAFIKALDIPLKHLDDLADELPGILSQSNTLLLTVDCQYGAGNVTRLSCDNIGVIDHHLKETDYARYERIESYLGSCATVVWRMLNETGYDLVGDKPASTALYYGLYTDTNSLAELFHPIDRDMLESLQFDHRLIRHLKGNNLSRQELLIAGQALSGARFDNEHHTAIFQTEPCDPNILGFISDLTIQAEGINTCIGFCEIGGGIKLSLRSGVQEVMASEMAAYLTKDVGSGGGNREKAGGFMRINSEKDSGEWIQDRVKSYFASYDKLEAGKDRADMQGMKRYRKKQVMVGYVILTDIYQPGTEITVRTLEGDAVFTVSADTYLMVGIKGEVYPIGREKFERSYLTIAEPFAFPAELTDSSFYYPTVRDKLYEQCVDLMPYIRACKTSAQVAVYARVLERSAKVFNTWYVDGYMYGRPGDYLAVREDDPDDFYIIESRIFPLTYELIE